LTVQGKVLVNGEEMGKQITFVSGVSFEEFFLKIFKNFLVCSTG